MKRRDAEAWKAISAEVVNKASALVLFTPVESVLVYWERADAMYPWNMRTREVSSGVEMRMWRAETASIASIRHGFVKARLGTCICHADSVRALLVAARVLAVRVV